MQETVLKEEGTPKRRRLHSGRRDDLSRSSREELFFAAKPFYRPCWADVDLRALRHNFQELRRHLSAKTKVLAELGVPVDFGASVRAAQKVFAEKP